MYGYVQNDPVAKVDPTGLAQIIKTPNLPNEDWPRPYHHAYIVVDQGCGSSGEQKWGLLPDGNLPYFYNQIGRIRGIVHEGRINGPGVGDELQRSSGNPNFGKALCDCILNSKDNPPDYAIPGKVCEDWAYDMWDCAKRTLHPRIEWRNGAFR